MNNNSFRQEPRGIASKSVVQVQLNWMNFFVSQFFVFDIGGAACFVVVLKRGEKGKVLGRVTLNTNCKLQRLPEGVHTFER